MEHNTGSMDIETNITPSPEVVYSVLFILDASGSMCSMGDEPPQAINKFNSDQKEKGEYIGTLVTFSDNVKFVYKGLKSSEIPELKDDDYKIGGMTALYDAIGDAIEFQRGEKLDNVIVVILTDGHENASRKYMIHYIRELITKMEKEHGWVFVYLGANQDSFAVAQDLGIHKSCDYEYNIEGFLGAMRSVSDNVARCISHEINPTDMNFPTAVPLERYTNVPIPSLSPASSFEVIHSVVAPSLKRS